MVPFDQSFRLREQQPWAPAGHEVACEQAVFTVAGASRPRPSERPELVQGIHNVGVRGAHFQALFSRVHGGLVSYRFGATPEAGRELLRTIPQPNFWHAPTANERGWEMPFRDGQSLLVSRYAGASERSPQVVAHDDSIEVRYTYLLPTTPAGECVVTYRVDAEGHVAVNEVVRPGDGLADLPEFGMLFTADAGLGRWATVTDEQGAGLRFDCAQEWSSRPCAGRRSRSRTPGIPWSSRPSSTPFCGRL